MRISSLCKTAAAAFLIANATRALAEDKPALVVDAPLKATLVREGKVDPAMVPPKGLTAEYMVEAKKKYPALMRVRNEAFELQDDMAKIKAEAKDEKTAEKKTAALDKKVGDLRKKWADEISRATKPLGTELEKLQKEAESKNLKLNNVAASGGDTKGIQAEAEAVNEKIKTTQEELNRIHKLMPDLLAPKKWQPAAKKDDKKKK